MSRQDNEVIASLRPTSVARALDVLSRLHPFAAIDMAEIGVWRGDMSAALLSRWNLCLLMVDNWRGRPEWPHGYRPEDMSANRARALEVTQFAGLRRAVCEEASVVAADRVNRGVLDCVFIDAEHTYEGVSADIAAWLPTIKSGGLICGHDYDNPPFPGVKVAVDEAFGAHNVHRGIQSCWYVRLPGTIAASPV